MITLGFGGMTWVYMGVNGQLWENAAGLWRMAMA
jgi:hypothetical protein